MIDKILTFEEYTMNENKESENTSKTPLFCPKSPDFSVPKTHRNTQPPKPQFVTKTRRECVLFSHDVSRPIFRNSQSLGKKQSVSKTPVFTAF